MIPRHGSCRMTVSQQRSLLQPSKGFGHLVRSARRHTAGQKCMPQRHGFLLIWPGRSQTVKLRSASSSPQIVALPTAKASVHHEEVSYLKALVSDLQLASTAEDKVELLLARSRVKKFLSVSPRLEQMIGALSREHAHVLLCLPALGQAHVFANMEEDDAAVLVKLQQLGVALCKADEFYSSLGGIVGYHVKCLQLIQDSQSESCGEASRGAVQFHMPQGPNLDGLAGQHIAAVEAAKGLEALPHMAEIWPLGGAGDRLGLKCEVTGNSVPTAMLPYCGRTLLEGLVRDLQARESLYFKLYGVQYTTPVVIMTSDAKKNDALVRNLLQSFNWFGRGEENFRVICQPLVPVVSVVDGRWVLPESLAPMMKPGGHGAIWKLMLDRGAFSWLASLDRQAALIRQISNPMAGTDATMLSLTGAGYADGRTFGFASCDRRVGATEGMNVLMQRQVVRPDGGVEYAYNVTNVEYTEFERLGMSDEHAEGSGNSVLPANTNILYVDLKAAEGAVMAGVASGGGAALPGLIFNGKKTVSWVDASTGESCTEPAGRMECTMQNLVDSLAQRFQEPIPLERHGELKTFVVFNKRRRVTSSAKRKRVAGSTAISQTPDGSFLDLMQNSREVLQRCGFTIPEVGDVEHFLKHGPGFIFLFHPSLGPLWDIIAQKIRGGALAQGSELVLEVAEASIVDLRLDGSLTVQAACIYGQSPAASARQDALRGGLLPIAGQAVSYPETGSEAMQYSPAIPDLAQASSMVVPLHRRKTPLAGSDSDAGQGVSSGTTGRCEEQGWGEGRTVYSAQCARVRLNGVVVKNKGIDWGNPDNVYWQHKVARREQVSIVLHGQSEFEASHVVLIGSHTFEVPDGYKMVVSSAPGGGIRRALSPLTGRRPSWQWRCLSGPEGVIQVKMEEPISSLPGIPLTSRPARTDLPFTYMI